MGVVLVKRVHTLFGRNAQIVYKLQLGKKRKECDRRCVRKKVKRKERSMAMENRTHHERMWMG